MSGIAGLALLAGGTAMSAMAQFRAGRLEQRIGNINAQFAEFQAQDAFRRGVENEILLRERIRGAIGQARAAYAAQNVDVNVGSAIDVQAGIAYQGERDILTIRNNAAREAWGYRVEAFDARLRGRMARTRGTMGAFTTILGAGGQYFMMRG